MSSTVSGLQNRVIGLVLAAALLALSIGRAHAALPSQPAADGEAIFAARCAGCHTIGGGRQVGPDLAGVTQRRDRQWLTGFIAAPNKVIASGDPIAAKLVEDYNGLAMPNLGLSQDQVAAVLAYLDAQGGGVGPPPTQTTAQPLPSGSSDHGVALFLNNVHLRNGGPPCMGCHSIDSAGALGGGVLGPNLSGAFANYGAPGLASALANIPWPTMKPIYADHPLETQEQADLRAFLQSAASRPQTNTEVPFIVLSLACFFAAMLVIGIVRRRQLRKRNGEG